jgi:hypothetical protein
LSKAFELTLYELAALILNSGIPVIMADIGNTVFHVGQVVAFHAKDRGGHAMAQ